MKSSSSFTFLGVIAVMLSSPVSAAGLPNGTCSGSGMTVTVRGGSIVTYQYQGRSYKVTVKGGSIYKIRSAGAIRVTSVKGNSFKGIMSLRGYETPATFNCK